MNIWDRAHRPLDCWGMFGSEPVALDHVSLTPSDDPQFVLRMPVQVPEHKGLHIPPELHWLESFVAECQYHQKAARIHHAYTYITVRHGPTCTTTDDLWHVDGFSMRIPHAPEQDYVWTNYHSTEALLQPQRLPDTFHPLRHNIHQCFQDTAIESNIEVMEAGRCYLMDPCVIHRRPPQIPKGFYRTFVRVSFVPIPIRDNANTINPLLSPQPGNNSPDFRFSLKKYQDRNNSTSVDKK
jgi:hypothetical protein